MNDKPYTPDQARVAAWLEHRTHGTVGAGEDPIGFVLASYELIHDQLKELQSLKDHCAQFVKNQEIYAAECVYQSDRVIQNAYEFIEGVCEIVGYCE